MALQGATQYRLMGEGVRQVPADELQERHLVADGCPDLQ